MEDKIHIATIWGHNEMLPVFSTHHSHWDETIRNRPDCVLHHYSWENWRTMPHDMDLYFFIDFHQELFSLFDKNYHPRVFFWWDAHHGEPFSYPSQLAGLFDKTYFAELGVASYLRFQGYDVKWLPPAFYPEVYRPLPGVEKTFDFAFVGQLDHIVRRHGLTRFDFAENLSKNPKYSGFVSTNMISYEINKMYNRSKILFERTIPITLGTRFFETIGSKNLLLMNRPQQGYNNGIDLVAADGIHYVGYDDTYQDFEYKLDYYLKHPEEREKIATQGYEHFLRNHTYNHRLDTILKDFHLLKN